MYNPKIDADELRQGDILSQVLLFGGINLKSIACSKVLYPPKTKTDGFVETPWWSINKSPQIGDVMVLSHSCEIARENHAKLSTVIVAPIRPMTDVREKNRIEELRTSNFIDPEAPKPSFVKLFYLEPNPLLEYSNEAFVDFSKCFSVRKQSYDLLLERKICQLSDSAAVHMALKLALYFCRNGDSTEA